LYSEGDKLLDIREAEGGEIIIAGITEKIVTSVEEINTFLSEGSERRATSATNMNDQSSRSHAIITVSLDIEQVESTSKEETKPDVESEDIDVDPSSIGSLRAKFHLVDLAGSERAKRTGATGDTMKEGIKINASLLALGNVISALGDEQKRKAHMHVPYRDSKLTRLLQDSLGGNSKTVLIGCASPSDSNIEETSNALVYVHRARNIKNKAVVNRDPQAAELLRLRTELSRVKMELKIIKGDATYVPHKDDLRLPGEDVLASSRRIQALEIQNCTLNQDVRNKEITIQDERKENQQLRIDMARWRHCAEEAGVKPEDETSTTSVLEDQLVKIKSLEDQLHIAHAQGYTEPAPTLEASDKDDDVEPYEEDLQEENIQNDVQLISKVETEAFKSEERYKTRSAGMNNELKSIEAGLEEREKLIRATERNFAEQQIQKQRDTYLKQIQEMEGKLKSLQKEKRNLLKDAKNSQTKEAKLREFEVSDVDSVLCDANLMQTAP
jgi:kinesin family protein 4/21/27